MAWQEQNDEKTFKIFSKRVILVAIVLTFFSLFYALGPYWGGVNRVFRSIGAAVFFPQNMLIMFSGMFFSEFPYFITVAMVIAAAFLPSFFYALVVEKTYFKLASLPLSRHFRRTLLVFYFVVLAVFLLSIAANNPAVFTRPGFGKGVPLAELDEYMEKHLKQSALRACRINLQMLGFLLKRYQNDNRGRFPVGATSGEIFKKLMEEDYLNNAELLQCTVRSRNDPFSRAFYRIRDYLASDEVDFEDPEGVGYYIDPAIPENPHPKRVIAADRAPWRHNHSGEGVNVLFADFNVIFIRPKDSGPPDKISNPYIEEDTDIYADTGNSETHAWIRWKRDGPR